jgi:biopolymer transport protein TolR
MQTDDSSLSLKSTINVTPLADVMLVLLIIFMVVTPLIRPGVEVDVPQAEHSREHPDNEETLVLSLKGDGSLYLNEDQIPESDLLSAMTSVLSQRDDKVLFLKANEALDYGYVLEMMGRCKTAGATEVALITKAKLDDEAG